jgi:hypothetical protein
MTSAHVDEWISYRKYLQAKDAKEHPQQLLEGSPLNLLRHAEAQAASLRMAADPAKTLTLMALALVFVEELLSRRDSKKLLRFSGRRLTMLIVCKPSLAIPDYLTFIYA